MRRRFDFIPGRSAVAGGLGVLSLFLASGCGAPNQANIALRKQNHDQQVRIDDLDRQHEMDDAALRQARSPTTIPTLPQSRLDSLFTVAGLSFGRLTGGDRRDGTSGPDDEIKVYVVPIDVVGDSLKSAGSFVVEAFDLAAAEPRIGRWEFPLADAAKNWYGKALLYTYVLPCPLPKPPAHADLTIKVTFVEGLTQRQFVAQRDVHMTLSTEASATRAVAGS